MQLQSDWMKRHYDAHLKEEKLMEGTPVWLHNPQLRKKGISPKLMRQWQGPFVVTKRINELVYHVQLGPKTKPKVVNRNCLWIYHGQNPPQWFTNKPDDQDHDSPSPPRDSPTGAVSPPPDADQHDALCTTHPRRSGRQPQQPI